MDDELQELIDFSLEFLFRHSFIIRKQAGCGVVVGSAQARPGA
jgi:hypothetical protein